MIMSDGITNGRGDETIEALQDELFLKLSVRLVGAVAERNEVLVPQFGQRASIRVRLRIPARLAQLRRPS
jgi:hypothetical protein